MALHVSRGSRARFPDVANAQMFGWFSTRATCSWRFIGEWASATSQARAIRLELEPNAELRLEILRRDGWRCRRCERLGNLEFDHLETWPPGR
jgi:hypothetical protein